MQQQINRDMKELNAENICNINDLEGSNVDNTEAKQQSFEEQAIHGQKDCQK